MHLSIRENSRTWELIQRYYHHPGRYFEFSKWFGRKKTTWLKPKERYSKLERSILSSLDIHKRDLELLYQSDPDLFLELYTANLTFLNHELDKSCELDSSPFNRVKRILLCFELNGNLYPILNDLKSKYLDLDKRLKLKYGTQHTMEEGTMKSENSETAIDIIPKKERAAILKHVFIEGTHPEVIRLKNNTRKYMRFFEWFFSEKINFDTMRTYIAAIHPGNSSGITKKTAEILENQGYDLGIPILESEE